ncbi:MAG: PAS domain S-box protein, partial [Candidatus Hydrogenedentes bacterium]|nr:PAS domain S-box protein [Candidatus Hydrogenedentota bacterium]
MNNRASQPPAPADVPDSLLDRVGEIHSVLARLGQHSGPLSEAFAADLLRHATQACQSLDAGIREFGPQIGSLRRQLAIEEERRKHADELFVFAYENSPFTMSLATLKEGRFRDVNQTFLDRLGFTRDELIGKTSFELGIFPEFEGRQWLIDAL